MEVEPLGYYIKEAPMCIRVRLTRTVLVAALIGSAVIAVTPARADCAPAHFYHCSPGQEAPFANDPNCTSPGKSPVVLVHGTYTDQTMSWNLFGPALHNAGYCIWSLDYGDRATASMEVSIHQITDFVVNTVLPTSSTEKVSLIGHSQGGLQIRHMLRHDDTIPVDDAISLAGSHYGTTVFAAPWAAQYGGCPACGEQVAGSTWMTGHMNAALEDATPGEFTSYTQIETKYDEVVTPYTNTFLPAESGVVTNITLQDKCPADSYEHVGIIYDANALGWVLNALATTGPADPTFVPTGCQ